MIQNRQSVNCASNKLHRINGIAALKSKIRSIDFKADESPDWDPYSFGVEVVGEHILINKITHKVRRAYLMDHKYRIGWVVDADLDICMLCSKEFGLFKARLKHHCRTCGALVCRECSPYFVDLFTLINEHEARTCRNCFGIKPGILTPIYKSAAAQEYHGGNNTNSTNSSPTTTITTVSGTAANTNLNAYSNNSNRHPTNPPPSINKQNSQRSTQNPNTLAAATTAQLSRNNRNIGTSSMRRDSNNNNNNNNNRSPINAEDLNLQKYYQELEEYEISQKPRYEEAFM